MDSEAYEELCRLFIAREVGLKVEEVKSVSIPNPTRPDLPKYSHQIDLFWETGDAIALYLNIANAKWRGASKVDQPDILLLQQVRQQTAAHKAFMLTNVGFTAGAVAAAKDHGIALHIVKPAFDVATLPRGDRHAVRAAIQELAAAASSQLYSHQVEHRGLDFTQGQTAVRPAAPVTHSTPVIQTRVAPASVTPAVGPAITRTGGGIGSGGTGGPGPVTRGDGGFSKR